MRLQRRRTRRTTAASPNGPQQIPFCLLIRLIAIQLRLLTDPRSLPLIVSLASFVATIALPTESHAATIRARYLMKYVGIEVGELAIVNNIGSSSYEAALQAHVTGIATVATSRSVSMKASGTIRKGTVVPSTFFSDQVGADQTRTTRVSLTDGNARLVEIDPPFQDNAERVPLTEEHKRNVIDPLSALILTVPPGERAIGPSTCNRTLRVFNGLFRADVELAYVRTEPFNAKGYSGAVAVCSARYAPLAGYNPNATMTKFMMANRAMEIRVAMIEDAMLAIPVSVRIPMPVGTASVELQDYSVEPTPGATRK
ncbi:MULTISPECIES: DUF3108 domain-containing protein [Bradyrhizobium]|uniref:DUF3108 domain-containing protein n=2 Tax=Nitrobacteraceae TaxID=41294 RepID=UPI0015985F6A|nr:MULTISPECIES: DUF3108 domain-containing protein [Bradyrhizobium]MDD1520741.1 hypothetical protein [Bradyrhizobium sp. WBAH30]MDD1545792.1 hypothetical protein [Bradyrhizobium sp. WBAH41]MDD1558947.1 hypothetical protein [Bradyrhizobium sp. WBAH23]MDD1566403.1 hypothetical protein [Bradyrhizobium sp. WBAH33]MDD1591996.1 hypothetical protein [Bradyrhizobium sp. WBAH42]